ncbi:winged helix-turn-helix transcriptional regulator [Streptomyces sp. NPDC091272]|uniref:winged helix-turn-helix transcriptional regulator n=1 Tax=Streptomyces sp. NPDC091272 TaxID=3365981 RepID=UPI003814BDC5
MSGFGPGDPFLSDCPARLVVELIGDISRKMLTQTLRRLQAHGLVSHHAYAEVPPRVEYELTPLGATLIEPIHMLTERGRANGDTVLDALGGDPEQGV